MTSSAKQVILSPEMCRLVTEHIRESLPNEAVGVLAGSAEGKVELVIGLPNISDNRRSFVADPFEQYLALRRIKMMGLELLAIYHSHPGGGSAPSAHDLKYAQPWQCWHLIVPVDASGKVPDSLEAFRCLPVGSIENLTVVMSQS